MVIPLQVRMYGRNCQEDGGLRAIHDGRNWLRASDGKPASGYQRKLIPLLDVQGEKVNEVALPLSNRRHANRLARFFRLATALV